MPALLDRLAADLADDVRTLSLTGPRSNPALRTALSAVAATLIAFLLHLDNPWWAGITCIAIVQHDRAATLARSVDRVLGTAVGALIGYLAAAVVADHLVFLTIAAGCTGFAIYGQERAEHGYALLLGGMTVILIMFGTLAQPGAALDLAVYRGIEIAVGVVVACAVDYAVADPAVLQAAAAPRPGVWTRPIDRELAVVAATGGIAIALIPLIWNTLDLPALSQTPISAFVILTAMRREPVWKAVTRAAGCFFGGAYALAALHFVGGSFIPWLAAFAVGLYLSAHVLQGNSDASYVGHQAAIAIIIAMVQGQGPSASILPAIDRLVGVFGGVVVVSICQPLIAPLIHRLIAPPQ